MNLRCSIPNNKSSVVSKKLDQFKKSMKIHISMPITRQNFIYITCDSRFVSVEIMLRKVVTSEHSYTLDMVNVLPARQVG